MFPVCPGHQQDAPGSAHNVHGADGPVDGLLPDGLVHVVDDEDGAPLFPGDLDEGAELPPHLVGGVDTRFLPDVGGEGVKDDKPCAGLSDGLYQPFIGKGEIPLLLADEQQALRVAPGADEPGDDGIIGVVLAGLVDDVDGGLACAVREGHGLAPAQHGGEVEDKGAFAVPGVPLHHRDLAKGDVGIPQPFDLPYLDLAGLCNFDFCHVTAPSIGLIMA